MLICSRRHSSAFLTDILQAKAIAIREDLLDFLISNLIFLILEAVIASLMGLLA